jgi:hypothetical protein
MFRTTTIARRFGASSFAEPEHAHSLMRQYFTKGESPRADELIRDNPSPGGARRVE